MAAHPVPGGTTGAAASAAADRALDARIGASDSSAVLSVSAAEAARDRLGVELPPLLEPPVLGDTADARADWLRRGWQELCAAGLADGSELAPFLADALRGLGRPELQLTVVVAEDGGGSRRTVLAATGDVAVVARITDGGLGVELVPPSGLARIAVGQLPDAPPGPGRSVSLLSEAVDRAVAETADRQDRLGAALRAGGLTAEDAALLAGVLGTPRLRATQIGGRGFDRLTGRTTWSPVTVNVLDTAAGRYFAQHRRGHDGRRWFSLAPTDRRRLLDRVGELIRQLQHVR